MDVLRFALDEGDFAVVLCEHGARLTVRVFRQQSRDDFATRFVQLFAFLRTLPQRGAFQRFPAFHLTARFVL